MKRDMELFDALFEHSELSEDLLNIMLHAAGDEVLLVWDMEFVSYSPGQEEIVFAPAERCQPKFDEEFEVSPTAEEVGIFGVQKILAKVGRALSFNQWQKDQMAQAIARAENEYINNNIDMLLEEAREWKKGCIGTSRCRSIGSLMR